MRAYISKKSREFFDALDIDWLGVVLAIYNDENLVLSHMMPH